MQQTHLAFLELETRQLLSLGLPGLTVDKFPVRKYLDDISILEKIPGGNSMGVFDLKAVYTRAIERSSVPNVNVVN